MDPALKIGDISLDVPFFQASLSGYSDCAMRKLARDFGAPLTFAGVMLAKIIMHPAVLRKPAFVPHDDEHPIGAQLLGRDPERMARAAAALNGIGYDVIDLNFACPVPKVLRRRRGGYLLNEPDHLIEISRRVRDAVCCPLTVKLRIGFDETPEARERFWDICERLDDVGIDALIVHGRTVVQKYTGRADWSVVYELKRRLPNHTIIGSGDVFTHNSVTQHLAGSSIDPDPIGRGGVLTASNITQHLTNGSVDGVAIARGAIGNPWLFQQARATIQGDRPPSPPTLQEQGGVIIDHFDHVDRLYAPPKAIKYFRKFAAGYCKRHPQRKKAQLALMTAKNRSELLAAVQHWYGLSATH